MTILAELLRGQDVAELFDAARKLARRRPALLIGLTFAAGFLVGRRLARAPQPAPTPATDASGADLHGDVAPESQLSPDLLVGVPPVPGGYGGMPTEE